MKLTSAERIERSQLIPGVRQTWLEVGVSSWMLVSVALIGAPVIAQPAPTDRFPYELVSDTLRAMQEPLIGKWASPERAYRFLWLRSFHEPILIQVEKKGPQQSLVVKMLDRPWSLGADGVQIGKLTVTRRRPMTEAEWNSLAELRQEGFWKQAESDPDSDGVDGADWIVEGCSWGEHHMVRRWSPESGAFRELCLAMLKLSGLSIPPDQIY